MNASATPGMIEFQGDATLGTMLAALRPHAATALVIDYGGRTIAPGYHITEVKAGSFVALDCGGHPDAWSETILQIEDPGPAQGRNFMPVSRALEILAKVATQVPLEAGGRLTFEIGLPDMPMQVFDADTLHPGADRTVLRLVPRAALCKPRHRATQSPGSGAQCCTTPARKACCA